MRALLLVIAMAGCMTPEEDGTIASGRADLELTVLHARIQDGLSPELTWVAGDDIASILIEVRGARGLYYLTKFRTPTGDAIEAGTFTTRSAREVPGLVDWLYPNSPTLSVDRGTYRIMLRGEGEGGGRISEDVEIRIYAKRAAPSCGIHLDFLIDEQAIDAADLEAGIDRVAAWVNAVYAPAGIPILDYSITPVRMPARVEAASATSVVDDLLAQARRAGGARGDSVHVVVVRTIDGLERSGYALGLPGPIDADRPNAAVLVSTGAYTGADGFLDVEGLASTVAHEVGHFLGLYHTSEVTGTQHDPIGDTPQCIDPSDCTSVFDANIMTSGGGARRTVLTPGQAFVMRQHPLCEPAVPRS